MKIFDTMRMKKVDLTPLEPEKLRMYVCGPTVYGLIHIGNARPMIVFDAFRRYLLYKGVDVRYVSNFTDVDDKIIAEAKREGVEASEIAIRYTNECLKDMRAMNIMPATVHPKATEEIPGMIKMIETLIQKGHAYVAPDGTVYFDVSTDPEYGKLSHKDRSELMGQRELKVTGLDQKRHKDDFVLWKPKKEGEPYWPSPWCDGRPGWHIECSVMCQKYLGDTIDIHAGGEDLIFPHHENEIAQSECATGKTFSRYWMHNAFLRINNEKMSKSLGNFLTVRDIISEYDPMVLRLFILSAHYRSPLNFSRELMDQYKASYERILNCTDNLSDLLEKATDKPLSQDETKNIQETERFKSDFDAAFEDDNNTANAETSLFEIVRLSNSTVNEDSSKEYVKYLTDTIHTLCDDVLGVISIRKKEDISAEIEELIAKRQKARKDKDYALADQIRDELGKRGIILEDTKEGVKWKKA